jgi:hypothetical protein
MLNTDGIDTERVRALLATSGVKSAHEALAVLVHALLLDSGFETALPQVCVDRGGPVRLQPILHCLWAGSLASVLGRTAPADARCVEQHRCVRCVILVRVCL